MKLKEDTHAANLFRQTREWLFENKPVQAMDRLKSLEEYVYKQYGDSEAKR